MNKNLTCHRGRKFSDVTDLGICGILRKVTACGSLINPSSFLYLLFDVSALDAEIGYNKLSNSFSLRLPTKVTK